MSCARNASRVDASPTRPMAPLLRGIRAAPVPLTRSARMHRLLDRPRATRGPLSPEAPAPAVSVLRWPPGRSASGVFEMFSARETSRLASWKPGAGAGCENVLLVSASRRVTPAAPAVLLSFINTSTSEAVRLSVKLAGRTPTSMAGTILTAPPLAAGGGSCAEAPAANVADPVAFRGAVLKGKIVEITVPARSVVVLTVHQHAAATRRTPARRVSAR
jgi:hypothetical protein